MAIFHVWKAKRQLHQIQDWRSWPQPLIIVSRSIHINQDLSKSCQLPLLHPWKSWSSWIILLQTVTLARGCHPPDPHVITNFKLDIPEAIQSNTPIKLPSSRSDWGCFWEALLLPSPMFSLSWTPYQPRSRLCCNCNHPAVPWVLNLVTVFTIERIERLTCVRVQ